MHSPQEHTEAFRKAESRLRRMLFGDGVYEPGYVRGEDPRRDVTRELRRLREAFEAAIRESDPARAETAEARAQALEQELRSVAAELRRLAAEHAPAEVEQREAG